MYTAKLRWNDIIQLYETLQSLKVEIESSSEQVKSEKQLNKRIELQLKLTRQKKITSS